MSYTLKERYIGPRHTEIDIIQNGNVVLNVTVRPYYFYRNKKRNFTDTKVPMYVEFTYGAAICTADIIPLTDMYAAFFDALKKAMASAFFECIVIAIQSKELYDFYIENYPKYNIIPEDSLILHDEESQKLVYSWEVLDKVVDQQRANFLFTIFKKDSLDFYKTEKWWDPTEELLVNDKTA